LPDRKEKPTAASLHCKELASLPAIIYSLPAAQAQHILDRIC